MGQIIFPSTLRWTTGQFTDVIPVGDYLRLAYRSEVYGDAHAKLNNSFSSSMHNDQVCWDLSAQTSWFQITNSLTSASVVAYLLWDSDNSLGGGYAIYGYEQGWKYSTRDSSSYLGEAIDDNTLTSGFARYYANTMYLYAMTPHRAQYAGSSSTWYGSTNKGYGYIRLAYVVAVSTTALLYELYDDVLNNRFKTSGEWLSPIIDMGPYIHITSLSVTNYVVPTGGAVNIYFRTSGSAPTTGSPTAFTDTSGNTLYYYPANAAWTASDWELVPSGSEPSYKDRYVQLKLELIGA